MANAPCELCGSTAGPDHPCPASMLGKVLDNRYQIESVLGQGGMGMVFRATQTAVKRPVAVKTLNPSLAAAPTFFERFRREAEVASRLRHPNIITIFDFGRAEDGTCYFVMELVPGDSLKQLVKLEGPLSLRRASAIVEQAARGLALAHNENVVHRDIKPHNLLISQVDGKDFVKILDFGLVKALEQEDEDQLTSTGQVLGTPQYMPPEQAGGEEVDRRSDLYSLGAVLYFCLTGASPFGANTVRKALTAALTQPVPLVSTRRLGAPVPRAIDEFFRKALAADKEDRHQTAEELIADMHAALRGCTDAELDAIPELPDPSAAKESGSAGSGRHTPSSAARSPSSPSAALKRQQSNVIVDPQLTVSKPRASLADQPPRSTAPDIPSLRTGSAPVPDERKPVRGNTRGWLLAAIPAALLIVGVGVVLKLRPPAPPEAVAQPAVATPSAAATPQAQAEAPKPAPQPAPQPAPIPSGVTVRLHSVPTGAEVYDGDTLIGHTELDLHLTRDRPHTLTFRLPGYQPEAREVDLTGYANSIKNVDVALTALPKAEPAKPKKKKETIRAFE